MKRGLAVAVFIMVCTICYVPSVQAAFTFTDDFSGGINPYWWNTYAAGSSVTATSGNVTIEQQGNPIGTSGGLGFKFKVTGDFTAQVDYTLNGPILNGERIGITSTLGAVERLEWNASNNWQLYLTHFYTEPGQLAGHTTTTDTAGKLQLSRSGQTLSGSFWNGTGWTLIHSYIAAENTIDTDLGFAIWPDTYAGKPNGGTVVTFDNFILNAPAMADPRGTPTVPIPAAVWLFGTGLLGLFGVRRKITK